MDNLYLLTKIKLARKALSDQNYRAAHNLLYLTEEAENLIEGLEVKDIDIDYVSSLSDKEFKNFVENQFNAWYCKR